MTAADRFYRYLTDSFPTLQAPLHAPATVPSILIHPRKNHTGKLILMICYKIRDSGDGEIQIQPAKVPCLC